jgi:endogenous inhibitor of DNA gyrase (YacG/DUF329 family)
MRVKCPQCGNAVEWKESPYRPFCSERCQLIDLGAWIEERYVIPGDSIDPGDSAPAPRDRDGDE